MLKGLTQDGTICGSPTALGTLPNAVGISPQGRWGTLPTALGHLPKGVGTPSQRLWGTFPTALGDLPLKQRRARRQATEDCSTTTEKHKNNYRNTLFQPIIQNKYVTLQNLSHIITSPWKRYRQLLKIALQVILGSYLYVSKKHTNKAKGNSLSLLRLHICYTCAT